MATSAFTTWLPEVIPNAPGCPEVLAINAIRNASIEWCNATNWWQGDYGTTAITTAILPYSFVNATGVMVTQVLVATYNGAPLAVTSIEELDSKVVSWRTATGQPTAIFQPTHSVVDFYPRPAGTDSYNIFMRVAYTPLRSATVIDATVREAYLEDIAAGALSRLLSMPGKPWTNEQAAASYDNTFKSSKVLGAIQASNSYGLASRHIQFRDF